MDLFRSHRKLRIVAPFLPVDFLKGSRQAGNRHFLDVYVEMIIQ